MFQLSNVDFVFVTAASTNSVFSAYFINSEVRVSVKIEQFKSYNSRYDSLESYISRSDSLESSNFRLDSLESSNFRSDNL